MSNSSDQPLRLVVLASGRGSNFRAIAQGISEGRLNARIIALYSDKADAGALAIASEFGIPTKVLDPKAYASRSEFDQAFFAQIDSEQPDLIVCAGYMRIISAPAVNARIGRIINIHPSLLPAYKGLHTHESAIRDRAAEHGATVHGVTAELDGGPLIAQARVCVLPDDTTESLAARVLDVEHPLLLACLNEWQKGILSFDASKVRYRNRVLEYPLQFESAAPFPLLE